MWLKMSVFIILFMFLMLPFYSSVFAVNNIDYKQSDDVPYFPQITDGTTPTNVNTLGLDPAMTASVNAYFRKSQSQTILYANMVNQQTLYNTVTVKSFTDELNDPLWFDDSK